MKKLWLRWALLTLFVIGLGVTFFNLGQWQLSRLEERKGSNAVVAAHESSEIRPYEQLMTGVISDADQWQRVSVTGVFDAQHQLVARYRSNAGATGWQIVTPLTATDGRTVLVDRGFGVRAPGTDFPSVAPAPPAGTVTVTGYVRRDERGDAKATTPTEASVRLVNSEAIAAWLGRPLVNGYISAQTVTPPQSGDLVPVEPPELTEGPHFSYAMQWFAFAVIAGFGLFILIRNDIVDRRKAAARAARATAQPPADSPKE